MGEPPNVRGVIILLAALAVIVAGYLLGSIPVGLLVVRAIHGIDIRRFGSGNVGTVNVLRTKGFLTALPVMVSDVAKGLFPVLVARWLGLSPEAAAAAGLAAVVGHSFSVFLRFTGGKSVATTAGVVLGLDPVAVVLSLAFYAAVVAVTRYASVGSLASAVFMVCLLFVRHQPIGVVLLLLAATTLIFIRHRSNIDRLVRGEELRLTFGRRRA